ncbi:MAG TPA: hypothetical protein VNF28_04990 [Candidatus Binataceae bacterium]|nr:hypothetical protein [Candidatus Binataceae bacterium]
MAAGLGGSSIASESAETAIAPRPMLAFLEAWNGGGRDLLQNFFVQNFFVRDFFDAGFF